MKKHIPIITIFIIIIGIITLGIWYSDLPRGLPRDKAGKVGKNSPIKQLAKLDVYSKEELSFLEKEGFLDDIDSKNLPDNKEQIISLFKSPGLIEQNLNSPDESFEVLATKLDLDNNTYQLAFKLENKSNQNKEFYLIPISESSQTEFKEIRGRISGSITEVYNTPLAKLYDVEEHKLELKPELAKAYDDIEKNGYTGKPIKLVLEANSTLIAQSKWEIIRGPSSDSLKPVYLLVYGSAGGVKDELTILTVHSSPQKGDNWEVEFTTRGTNDLRIIPNDQATIDDDEFIGLYCNNEKRTPQVLLGDIIYYPNWQCNGIGRVVHYTKKAGKHTLRFQFGGQTAFAYNSPGLIDGLVSYWKLDDNLDTNAVLDAHGSNDGTVVNDQTNYSSEQSTTTAKIERAFDFDGSNDYVDTGFKSPPRLTISAWIDVNDDATAKTIIAADDDGAIDLRSFQARIVVNETFNMFVVSGSNVAEVSDASINLVTGWHHVVGTFNGTTLTLYVDGNVDGTPSVIAQGDINSNFDVTIGSEKRDEGYFNGIIDEVGIWNRALTQDEITELYNSGNGLAYPFTEGSAIRIKGGLRVKGGLKIKF